jgi:hypothetical protein
MDWRHARIFTLSVGTGRPRDVILLVRSGGWAALAVGTPAATVVVPLLVPYVTVSIIPAVSIPIPILILTVAIHIPVTISVALTITITVLLTVTVPVSLTITVTAATATGATGTISAWWR